MEVNMYIWNANDISYYDNYEKMYYLFTDLR